MAALFRMIPILKKTQLLFSNQYHYLSLRITDLKDSHYLKAHCFLFLLFFAGQFTLDKFNTKTPEFLSGYFAADSPIASGAKKPMAFSALSV